MRDLLPETESAVSEAVFRTIRAFLVNPAQFHGDGGIAHFLFTHLLQHPVLTQRSPNGVETCLIQTEHHTRLLYQRAGQAPSRGRFDVAVIGHNAVRANGKVDRTAPPLVGFEVGKNKDAMTVCEDILAKQDHPGPRSSDAGKLLREVRFAGMKNGCLLEFYDQQRANLAQRTFDCVTSAIRQCVDLPDSAMHVVVVAKCPGADPWQLLAYPAPWSEELYRRLAQALPPILQQVVPVSHATDVPVNLNQRRAADDQIADECIAVECSNGHKRWAMRHAALGATCSVAGCDGVIEDIQNARAPCYKSRPLNEYQNDLRQLAARLFHAVNTDRKKEHRGSYSILGGRENGTLAKIVIWDTGNPPGVYVWIRANGPDLAGIWSGDMERGYQVYFDLMHPAATIAIFPRPCERFTYFQVHPEDDLPRVASLLAAIAKV